MIGPRPRNVFRGVGLNVNGLPVSVDDEKNEHFFIALRQYQVNSIMLQEVNLNEGNLGRRHKLWKRVRTQLGPSAKLVHAYNQHDATGTRQLYGGTGIISTGDAAHLAMGCGVDPSHMGRWCWARFRGRNNIVLRLVSAYPVSYTHLTLPTNREV